MGGLEGGIREMIKDSGYMAWEQVEGLINSLTILLSCLISEALSGSGSGSGSGS